MNSDYEDKSMAEIDRLLKELPELTAPPTLARRVMGAIKARGGVAWYRQSWEAWPKPWQAVLVTLLLALFGGLCLAGARLPHVSQFVAIKHHLQIWATNAGAVGNALLVIVNAFIAAVRNFGMRFLIAALVAAGIAYTLCVGLGTMCVRLAFARHYGPSDYE